MSIKSQLEKLFKENKLSTEDFNILIIEYVAKETGKEPTSEQLNEIQQLFKSGIFELEYVIDRIGSQPDKYEVQIETLYSESGNLINRFVYDF